jgi:hypothetical protein
MKPGMLCLLLLSGCLTSDDPPRVFDYVLTWTCLSPEGCERTDGVQRIDRLQRVLGDFQFTSTQDESFRADATLVISDFLPQDCLWLYFLSLFDHELERSRFCFIVGGFEWELAIPNQDPTTSSMWLVEGRDVNLF